MLGHPTTRSPFRTPFAAGEPTGENDAVSTTPPATTRSTPTRSATATPEVPARLDPQIEALLKRDGDGLVAAVVQEQRTGEVLMVGYMDATALQATLTTGRTTFWSRSRQEYWVKGETSGHRQWVREVRLDCDGDALLVTVHQEGPACHTGDRTCFDARLLPSVRSADADA